MDSTPRAANHGQATDAETERSCSGCADCNCFASDAPTWNDSMAATSPATAKNDCEGITLAADPDKPSPCRLARPANY